MIDPALQEQIASSRPEDEMEAVMLLQPGHEPPPPARPVARFGDIVTCRLEVEAIVQVRRHPSVRALKAARVYGGTDFQVGGWGTPPAPSAARRRTAEDATGRGVVLAVLDWGCDFAHPNFIDHQGRTRLLALWDQRRPARHARHRYGYGTIYGAPEIDRALGSRDPYTALGYHPAEADPTRRGTHGTHVMDIAAGNGRCEGTPVGMAPDAHLVFVHLAARTTPLLCDLGDSVRVLEAFYFVQETAGDRPWVVNMSLGRTGGDHTGRSLVERAIDHVLEERAGRACVLSAGNYYAKNLHAEGLLRPGGRAVLDWHVAPDDRTPNELEIWYSGRDRCLVRLASPAGQVFVARLDESRRIHVGGREVGRLYHRAEDSASGDHHVDLFLDPGAPPGRWQVTLEGLDVVDGRYHAWIERDVSQATQSSFAAGQASPRSTIGTIANGYRTIVVGACHEETGELGAFSSSGPTRDGRSKPDIVAPGVDVWAARSTPRGADPGAGGLVSMSGTSMATPHVAGATAALFEAAGRPLRIEETRALLLGTASGREAYDGPRVGAGRLDFGRALVAAAELGNADGDGPREGGTTAMATGRTAAQTLEDMGHTPDTVYRHVMAGSAALPGLQVVALPGQRPPAHAPGTEGDLLLVRVALGEPGLGCAATLASGELASPDRLAAQGVPVEEAPPGGYAVVVDASGPRARLITNADGIVPPGQVLLLRASPGAVTAGESSGWESEAALLAPWAGRDDMPAGDADGAESPLAEDDQKDDVDPFLDARTNLYKVSLVGTNVHVSVPRTHDWTDRYTNRALALAGTAATIRALYGAGIPIDTIKKAYDKVLAKGVKLIPATQVRRGEGAVQMTIIDVAALEKIEDALGFQRAKMEKAWLAKRGEAYMLEYALGTARKSFETLKPHFSDKDLAEARISVGLIKVLLEKHTQSMIEVSKRHAAAAPWRAAFQRNRDLTSWTRGPALTDFDQVPLKQWADAVLAIARDTRKLVAEQIERRREEDKKHFRNEHLRPHLIKVANPVEFILDNYDSSHKQRIDPYGWEVRGGDQLYNAKNEPVFLLNVNSTRVIFQHLGDKQFYEQSLEGFGEELLWGIYTAAGQKSQGAIKLTKWVIGLLGTVFPIVRVTVTAADVISAGHKLQARQAELERGYESLKLAYGNIDKLDPGGPAEGLGRRPRPGERDRLQPPQEPRPLGMAQGRDPDRHEAGGPPGERDPSHRCGQRLLQQVLGRHQERAGRPRRGAQVRDPGGPRGGELRRRRRAAGAGPRGAQAQGPGRGGHGGHRPAAQGPVHQRPSAPGARDPGPGGERVQAHRPAQGSPLVVSPLSSHTPDDLYRRALAGSAADLPGVQVVALPGERLPAAPGPEDQLLLVRVALGEPGLGCMGTLEGGLATPEELAARGVAVEEGPAGRYALVVEGEGPDGSPRARRITDALGVVLPGQVLLQVGRRPLGTPGTPEHGIPDGGEEARPAGGASGVVDPFPPAYPLPLETAHVPLNRCADAAAQQPDVAHLCGAVADVTNAAAPPPYRGHHDGEMLYVASLAKVYALYAAYELRRRVEIHARSRIAAGLSTAKPGWERRIFSELKAAWQPRLDAAFPRLPRGFPRLAEIFEVSATGDVTLTERRPALTDAEIDAIGEFGAPQGGFRDWLRLTLRWSNNSAASRCILALGYPYINGALRAAGFFDAATDAGLWLSGDYLGGDWLPGDAAGRPLARRWAALQGRRVTNFGGTALQVARLLTLLAQGKLVDAPSSAEMVGLMTGARGIGSYIGWGLAGRRPPGR